MDDEIFILVCRIVAAVGVLWLAFAAVRAVRQKKDIAENVFGFLMVLPYAWWILIATPESLFGFSIAFYVMAYTCFVILSGWILQLCIKKKTLRGAIARVLGLPFVVLYASLSGSYPLVWYFAVELEDAFKRVPEVTKIIAADSCALLTAKRDGKIHHTAFAGDFFGPAMFVSANELSDGKKLFVIAWTGNTADLGAVFGDAGDNAILFADGEDAGIPPSETEPFLGTPRRRSARPGGKNRFRTNRAHHGKNKIRNHRNRTR